MLHKLTLAKSLPSPVRYTQIQWQQWAYKVWSSRYLFILRMHCCDAFSLSQSVLSVGSQDVAWICDNRPAPARFGAPVTPSPMLGGRVGATEKGADTAEFIAVVRTSTLLPYALSTGLMESGIPGAITARPVSAAAAGGGEAGLALLVECPGRELPKLGNNWAPLPWLVPTAGPMAPFDFSPTLSAIVVKRQLDNNAIGLNVLFQWSFRDFTFQFVLPLSTSKGVNEVSRGEMIPTYGIVLSISPLKLVILFYER